MEEAGLAAAEKKGGTLVFVDESGFSEGPVVRRTWAPRGQTPILRAKCRSWRRKSAMGGLAYRTDGSSARLFLLLHDGEIRSPQVLRFLRHLRRHVRGKILIIWDGLQAHRSRLVRDWVDTQSRLEITRLPAYAPELNPVEALWSVGKTCWLANVCEGELEPVVSRVRQGARRLRRREHVLWGFLSKAGLSLPTNRH